MTPHPVHARRAAELARGRPGHVAAAESKAKRCAARALCGSSASRRAGGGEAELVGSCALAGNVGQPSETCRILSRALAVDPFDRMRRVRRFGSRDCGFCFSRWAACILAQESGLFAFGLARKSILPMPRLHPTQAHPKAHAHINARDKAKFAAAPAYRTEQGTSDEHQTRHAAKREQAVDDVADDTMDLRTRRRRESGRRSEQPARRAVKHAHS